MPKPKTDNQTLLNRGSNLGRERAKTSPVRLISDFTCPKNVKGEAAKFWRKQMPILVGLGIISTPELPVFQALCECWADYRNAFKNCPLDYHTHVKLRQELTKMAMQFGLTPATRANVVASNDNKKDDEKSYSIKVG